jgi:WD40 repeat protein/serine/threonine protein kinase
MAVVVCPSCAKRLQVPDTAAGKKVRCPNCQHLVPVPAARTPPVDRDVTAPASGSDGGGAAPPPELLSFLAPPQRPDELGRLGPYRILRVLGAGGMGVVYKAEDPQLQRLVALKAMLPHLSAPAARQRFLGEARSVAALKHDHVVTVYQVGEDRGVPYLAMEFLEGEPLDQRLGREGQLPAAEVVRLGREVAEALAAAHERGLVHRDIKPANLWLEGRRGRVKVLDFGLARPTDDSQHLTQTGAIVGTPAYMAPEQANGQGTDARSDLFSLGCVLYRLATGRPAFQGNDTISTLLAVATQQPPVPGELNPGLPQPLSDLIVRLLAKRPADRPPSARAVADALATLEGGPTQFISSPSAAPSPPAPRSSRSPVGAARQKTGAAAPSPPAPRSGRRLLLATAALVLLAGTAAALYFILPTLRSPGPAAELSVLDRLDAQTVPAEERFENLPAGVVAVLGQHRQRHWLPIGSLTYSPDGKRLATGGNDHAIRLWDAATLHQVDVLTGHTLGVHALAFSRDGNLLASASHDATVRVWDLSGPRGKLLQSLPGHGPGLNGIAFDPEGQTLAFGGAGGRVWLWYRSDRRLKELVGDQPAGGNGPHYPAFVNQVLFSPNGTMLASHDSKYKVLLWDVTGRSRWKQPLPVTQIAGPLLFTAAGPALLGGSNQGVWRCDLSVTPPRQAQFFVVGGAPVLSMAASADGKVLAVSRKDGGVPLYDLKGMQTAIRYEVSAHPTPVAPVRLSPDGRILLSVGTDQTVRLWDLGAQKAVLQAELPHRKRVHGSAFAPDSKALALADAENSFQVWDLGGAKATLRHPLQGHRNLLRAVAFAADDRALLSSGEDQTVRLWDLTVSPPRERQSWPLPDTDRIWASFAPDGKPRAGSAGKGQVQSWDLSEPVPRKTGTADNTNIILRMTYVPDGRLVFSDFKMAEGVGRIYGWDVSGGPAGAPLPLQSLGAQSDGLALAPDGRTLASGSADGTLRLWDLSGKTAKERDKVQGHGRDGKTLVWSVAFAPDGQTLASGGNDQLVQLWRLANGKFPPAPATCKGHRDKVRAVTFTPDGRLLASSDESGLVILWDAATQAKRHEWQLPGLVLALAFAHDRRHLATANGNGTVYILRLPPHAPAGKQTARAGP